MVNRVRNNPVVHQLYGVYIRTPWPVMGVAPCDRSWDIEFIEGDAETLAAAASYVPSEQQSWWAQCASLPDGSAYRRWTDLFEFLVTPDARQIQARLIGDSTDEAMLAYLLVDALSFSMVRLGKEPLHAAAVVTERGAIAFLGNSGDGKSTLAALFVHRGATLLTDDMLVLTRVDGRWLVEPGPPRLKLYRRMADRILGPVEGAIPMNGTTEKLIIPLAASHVSPEPVPLIGMYILDPACDPTSPGPAVHRLSPAAAFPRVLGHTAGHYPSEQERLRRQFGFATTLVRDVPIHILSYARHDGELLDVSDAVLADLARSLD
jgi:hypothetical protein